MKALSRRRRGVPKVSRRLNLPFSGKYWRAWPVADGLFLFLLVVLGVRTLLDPDYGWHLKAGLDFLKNWRLPLFDPYSYTAVDWRWVDHEWLSNIILAVLHTVLTPLGLSLLFGFLTAFIFLLAASLKKIELPYKILSALIALLAALPILGVRVQVVTLLGLAFLLYLFYRYRAGEIKRIWWLPLLFILWANLHGGFILGLFTLALLAGAELLKLIIAKIWPRILKALHEPTFSWRAFRQWVIVGLFSGAATLVNPYGWRLHYDIYLTLTDKFAISNISEWLPVSLSNPISYNYLIYLVLFGLVLLLVYRQLEPTRWIVSAVFLYLSLLHWRNMPFFMIMSVGFLAEIIQTHTRLVFRQIVSSKLFLLALVAIVSLLTAQRIQDIVPKSFDLPLAFRSVGYPIDAIAWAKKNPDKIGKKMFNEYGWGGLLIWRFPEQPVFIDGRMPYWRSQGRFIFLDHQVILGAHPGALELMDQYGIDWVLINAGRPLDWVLLGREEWEKVYNDPIAVIYRKKAI